MRSMGIRSYVLCLCLIAASIRHHECLVDVHFENKEGGFFLKHSGSTRQPQQPAQPSLQTQQISQPFLGFDEIDGIASSGGAGVGGDNSVLSIDRFTVFQSTHPVSVRAVYGPFSTKQTVPARYIVPDPPPPPSSLSTAAAAGNGSALGEGAPNDPLANGRRLEVSAHLVNHEIARDSPVLRVLFHTSGVDRSARKFGKQQAVCVVLHVAYGEQSPLTTTCSPSLEDGQCLAEITVPSTWWAPLPSLDQTKAQKTPRRSVLVSYYVLEPKMERAGGDDGSGEWRPSVDNCSPHLQIQPLTRIESVPLANARSGYRELKMDDVLFTLVPVASMYPRSKVYIPVYTRFQLKPSVLGFVIKGKVKSGLKILDAQCRQPDNWNLNFTPNQKYTAATVTVTMKNSQIPVSSNAYNQSTDFSAATTNYKANERIEEVFSWLLEVEHESVGDIWNEEAHIVWIVHYLVANSNAAAPYLIDVSKTKTEDYPSTPSAVDNSAPSKVHSKRADKMKHKVTARFEIYKDITQAVLPVSKTWELINTALLTGKQVSQPMKIFVVSQSGKIADVTRQSTCHTEDDSVLKVTSSCSSVYVDGSEMRGSSNATILVKYETFTGTASFLVWMPELSELDIVISDVKLSQIYDWSVPNSQNTRLPKVKRWSKSYEKLPDDPADSKWPAQKYNKNVNFIPSSESVVENEKSNSVCKLKYQQSTIDVYTRFKAVDHDTGRVSYLINRKTWLKITDLVMRGLRIADPHIAILNGRIIVGRSTGRTDVQIVSPLTGRVLGSKEIRVVSDKVSITKLLVNVVSGLQLNIVPDSSGENIYIAETSITRKLSAQYQEGLLDIEVEFSDGTVTSLSDINSVDYAISVDSLSPDVVAFAPMLASRHPRVIAVGEGKGNLLKVSLLLPDTCRSEAHLKDFTLVSTSAFINVDFYDSSEYGQRSPMFVQNDGGIGNGNSGFFGSNGKEKKRHESEHSSDLQDILSGISSSGDVLKEPAVQARQHQVGKNGYYSSAHRHPSAHLGPMEMGMYIILAAFSFAIIVFVVSCVVYASKYKPQNMDFQDDAGDSTFTSGGYKLLTSQANGGGKQISQLREPTTTNVHDWVWLGRATLERASGLLVPSISVNDKMRRQKNYKSIRITSNPTYTPQPNPDTDLNADSCFRARSRANESRIDSKTYRKKSYPDLSPDNPNTKLLGSPRQRCFRLPVIPHQQPRRCDEVEEYKPPVPPHQNLDVANPSQTPSKNAAHSEEPVSDVVYRHKHHHHHHRGHHHNHHHHHKSKPTPADVSSKNADTFLISKKGDAKNATTDEDKRLQFVNSSDNLSKIKKANIVGNPMFSVNKSEEETDDAGLGIEDLNLGMDYKQIMEYFNNLKESTA